ncbi:hypothetical protein CDEST_03697 [Colletotrichum destructivum]|uniref:Uncharacterized protein n=1 Tax=Colletotrichum destructivum TaxID=34406 RepID=A0AAX4I6T2_9PEZI|nr:hypothetical protein CDEST_03697 [Colletotrichum destructivum]
MTSSKYLRLQPADFLHYFIFLHVSQCPSVFVHGLSSALLSPHTPNVSSQAPDILQKTPVFLPLCCLSVAVRGTLQPAPETSTQSTQPSSPRGTRILFCSGLVLI